MVYVVFFWGGRFKSKNQIFIVPKNQELSWLVHRDLNMLKSWAGVPQTASGWNDKWDQYTAKKQKNRGRSF